MFCSIKERAKSLLTHIIVGGLDSRFRRIISLLPAMKPSGKPCDSDLLHHIITIPIFYLHKTSSLRWFFQACLLYGLAYICLLLYSLAYNRKEVVEQDVFGGAIVFEVGTRKLGAGSFFLLFFLFFF